MEQIVPSSGRGVSRGRSGWWARPAFALVVGWIVVWGAGCTKPTVVVIPELDTAQEQYLFALGRESQTPILSKDKRRRDEQLHILLAAHSAVIDRFPEDNYFRPRAMVMKAAVLLKTDWPRSEQDALALLAEVERSFPEDDELLATSLLVQGKVYDALKQYDRAQQKYREVFDRFGKSADPALRQRAAEARSRYNRVRTHAESRR